jgi:hypothetical protein
MQLIQFPSPDSAVQEQVVNLLEAALDLARQGEVTSVLVVLLDDRDEDDSVSVMAATDGWVQTAGMLAAANKAL